jgi:uncharacterized protein
MKSEHVKVHIKGVAMDQTASASLLLLEEDGSTRVLPIKLNPFEANAILMELDGMAEPHQLTHDSLIETLARHGFSLKAVEIYGLLDDSHCARLAYGKGRHEYSQGMSPADAIAIALRADLPLYVAPSLLEPGWLSAYPGLAEADKTKEIYYLGPEWRPRSFL